MKTIKPKFKVWQKIKTGWYFFSTIIAMFYSEIYETWRYSINWSLQDFTNEKEIERPTNYELSIYY